MQVCASCYTRLPAAPSKLCPTARCEYDRPPRHSLMAERMIASGGLVLDCKNADHGCQETGDGEELEEHLGECLYREVPCPWALCQARVRLSELDRHITSSPDHQLNPCTPCLLSKFQL